MRRDTCLCNPLLSLFALLAGCALYLAAPAEARGQQPAPEAKLVDSVALTEARKKVKDIRWEIERAESELRQLSPPVRMTDSKGTTFNADKQRQYNNDRARIDRELRHLKEERTIWEVGVSQLVSIEDERNRATR